MSNYSNGDGPHVFNEQLRRRAAAKGIDIEKSYREFQAAIADGFLADKMIEMLRPELNVVAHRMWSYRESGIPLGNEKHGHLTARQKDIIRGLIRGQTQPEIAKDLFISYETIKTHMVRIRQITETKTLAELVAYVLISGLLD